MKHSYYIRQNFLLVMYRNHVYDFAKFFRGKTVLEVGSNKGTLFRKYFRSAKTHMLLEPNQLFLKRYEKLKHKHDNVRFEIKSFESFQTTETFDTILMIAVIAHIRWEAQKIYEKIDSLLNPGGTLVIETNNTRRNLEVMDYCKKNYELVEAKKSYTGVLKWLRIDDREVYVYAKPQ